MITLSTPPRLGSPTAAVRISFLTGEQADCLASGSDTEWLGPASEDFDAYVTSCQAVRRRWDVPFSTYWYTAGQHYLGTLVIRHELTPALLTNGGHIGYHISPAWRRQGHATAMLVGGLTEARRLGLSRVLLTCDPRNEASRKTIVNNGGELDESSVRSCATGSTSTQHATDTANPPSTSSRGTEQRGPAGSPPSRSPRTVRAD